MQFHTKVQTWAQKIHELDCGHLSKWKMATWGIKYYSNQHFQGVNLHMVWILIALQAVSFMDWVIRVVMKEFGLPGKLGSGFLILG